MATVVNPPSSRFRAAILQHGLSAGGTEKSGASKGLENPLLGSLGDPSLNQTFNGPFAGLAQYGQSVRQHQAFQKQNADLEQTMNKFGDAIKEAGGPGGMVKFFQDNPKALLTFHAAGVDPQKLIQPFMTGQPGIQTQDLPGGAQVVIVRGEDGKTSTHVVQPHNGPAPRTIGVDANNNVVTATGNGPDTPHPGVTPTSVVTNQNTREGADARAQLAADSKGKAVWNSAIGTWVYQGKGNQAPVIAGTNTPAQGTPEGGAVDRKLTPPEANFYANSRQLYQALDDLQALAPKTAGLLSGKIQTVSGKLLGTNEWGVAWNSAIKSAENAIAQKDISSYYSGIKEKLGNLPREYQAATQVASDTSRWKSDIQNQVGTIAANHEGANYQLPLGIADTAAQMGVFTKQNTPTLNKFRQNPQALSDKEIDNLSHYVGGMPPDDQQKIVGELQRRVQGTANNATAGIPTQQAPQQQQAPAQQAAPAPAPGQPLAPATTPNPQPVAQPNSNALNEVD